MCNPSRRVLIETLRHITKLVVGMANESENQDESTVLEFFENVGLLAKPTNRNLQNKENLFDANFDFRNEVCEYGSKIISNQR